MIGFSMMAIIVVMQTQLAESQDAPPPEPRLDATREYSPTTDIKCENGQCNLVTYSYEKYFFREDEGRWVQINETFFPCDGGFCTRNYHYRAKVFDDGRVSAQRRGRNITLRINDFLGNRVDRTPHIRGSVVTFNLVRGLVDLQYQFLPRELKEFIIIKERLPEVLRRDFNFSFVLDGDGSFDFGDAFVCDASLNCTDLVSDRRSGEASISILADYLWYENRTFPVIIDPSLTLNDTDISWNGHLFRNKGVSPNTNSRISNPPFNLSVGRRNRVVCVGFSCSTENFIFRAVIEFDITPIPANVDTFQEILLKVNVDRLSTVGERQDNITVNEMEMNNTDYPNNGPGNSEFGLDAGNGTLYNITDWGQYGLGEIIMNITDAGPDLLDRLAIQDWFGLGFKAEVESKQDAPQLENLFSSRDNPTASQRPYMNLTFNQTDTCFYVRSTGNHFYNCSDNCVISINMDHEGNNISIIGAGTFTLDANITNFNTVLIQGDGEVDPDRCTVSCQGGCFSSV